MKPRRRYVGPYSEERPDPAPDCYTVERQDDGVFIGKHYPTIDSTKPCCTVKVTQREGESDVETLARADRLVAQHHAQLQQRQVAAEAIA